MSEPALIQNPKTLISEEQIAKRVQELSAQIDQDYQGKEIVAICVLKGGVVFYTDIIRAMKESVRCEFIAVSSYGNEKQSSGEVKLTMDVKFPLHDKHVIVFEDIVDSGLTLQYLVNLLKVKQPTSVKVCTLLSKPECHKVDLRPDYVGFEIGNEFVVGYGLDYAGLYRDLPYVGVLEN